MFIAACPEAVELGWSNDMFGDEVQCNWFFGAATQPAGNWAWRIIAKTRIALLHRDTGVCDPNTLSSNCRGRMTFHAGTPCESVGCTEARGACCHLQTGDYPGYCEDDVNIARAWSDRRQRQQVCRRRDVRV